MKNKHNSKNCIASVLLCLCLLIGMLTVGVTVAGAQTAAEPSDESSTAVTGIESENTLFLYGGKVYASSQYGEELVGSDYGITSSGNETDGYTYTFTNLNFTTTTGRAVWFYDEIRPTLILVGENKIKGGDPADDDAWGIYASNGLIIDGTGSLTATAGDALSEGGCSYGIYTCSDLTIRGGNVIGASGNASQDASGILSVYNLTVEGGSVTGFANGMASSNWGIYADESFTVSGGTVYGEAGASNYNSVGIYNYCYGDSTSLTVTGGTVTGVGDFIGIFSGNPPIIEEMTVTASDNRDGTAPSVITDWDGTNAAKKWIKIDKAEIIPYDIFVGGIQVTSLNATDILGDGTASYDHGTNTLTLDGADITEYYAYIDTDIDIHALFNIYVMNDIIINLVGENTMFIDLDDPNGEILKNGIYAINSNVTFVGTGSLYITNDYSTIYADSVTLGDYYALGSTHPNVTITDLSEITFNSDRGEFMIEDKYAYTLYLSTEAPVPNYGVWVGGVPVTEENKDNITGSGISLSPETGRASYDPETRTLYLVDAMISGSHIDSLVPYNSAIFSNDALNIVISGKVIIFQSGDYGLGILTMSDLNIARDPDDSGANLAVISEFAAVGSLGNPGIITVDGFGVLGSAEMNTQNQPTEPVEIVDGMFWISGSNFGMAKMLLFEEGAIATEADLYVGGVAVTPENAYDILGDGTAYYDEETNTLTLKNAYITSYFTGKLKANYEMLCNIFTTNDLIINLLGENRLFIETADTDVETVKCGIYAELCNLTFKGSGALYITNDYGVLYAAGVNTENMKVYGSNNYEEAVSNLTEAVFDDAYDQFIVNEIPIQTVYIISDTLSAGIPIWVGGVRVTEENAADVLGDGTVSYDPETGTLTLNGANITEVFYDFEGYYDGIFTTGDLTVVIKGENVINVSEHDQSYAIWADGNLRIVKAEDAGTAKLFATSVHTPVGSYGGVTYGDFDVFGSNYMNDEFASDSVVVVDGFFELESGEYISTLIFTLPHTHSWSVEWQSDENGHWHECTAENCPITENYDKDGYASHIEELDDAVAPKCTEYGLTAGSHCSECTRTIIEQEPVDPLGHTAGDEATCTTAQICTVCTEELVAALGHTFGDYGAWVDNGDGTQTKTASCICGETTSITENIPAVEDPEPDTKPDTSADPDEPAPTEKPSALNTGLIILIAIAAFAVFAIIYRIAEEIRFRF